MAKIDFTPLPDSLINDGKTSYTPAELKKIDFTPLEPTISMGHLENGGKPSLSNLTSNLKKLPSELGDAATSALPAAGATVGGFLGGAGGFLAGGPFGAWVGSGAGAGAGAALGTSAQQAVRGQEQDLGESATNAATYGGLDLIGGPVLNVARKGINAVARTLAGSAAKKAAIEDVGSSLAMGRNIGAAKRADTAIQQAEKAGKALVPPTKTFSETLAGKIAPQKVAARENEKLLGYIRPTQIELGETEYEKLLNQKRIEPRHTLTPPRYILSDAEKNTALKYKDVINPDPVRTTNNLNDKIASLDDDVGGFLSQNNGIFSKGELKNKLLDEFKDLEDITIPQKRLEAAKDLIVSNFVDSLEINDMKSLWQARKLYDQKIQSAFSGSPTLQKEVKVKLRNAVQDYIADRTPNNTYKAYMKDMSQLFHLRDIVNTKAVKSKSADAIKTWIDKNPRKAAIVGLISSGVVGSAVIGGVSAVHAAGQ